MKPIVYIRFCIIILISIFSVSLTFFILACDPNEDDVCIVSGCSGQICSEESMASTCEYKPEYQCLEYTRCGAYGPGNSCAWEPTEKYLDCLDMVGRCGFATQDYITIDELFANQDKYNGTSVLIKAKPVVGLAMCTLMACSPANPCCNNCSAEFRLISTSSEYVSLNGSADFPVGCSGNECNYMDNCTPFDGSSEYYIRGDFSVGQYGSEISVKEVCKF